MRTPTDRLAFPLSLSRLRQVRVMRPAPTSVSAATPLLELLHARSGSHAGARYADPGRWDGSGNRDQPNSS